MQVIDEGGTISVFFRQLWETIRVGFSQSPTIAKASSSTPDPNAAVGTTTIYTTLIAAVYSVSAYARKTVADGVSSSLQLTIGWVESGVPQSHTFPAMTTDSTTSPDSQSWTLRSDALANITFAWAYTSNTPGAMHFLYDVLVEQMV